MTYFWGFQREKKKKNSFRTELNQKLIEKFSQEEQNILDCNSFKY